MAVKTYPVFGGGGGGGGAQLTFPLIAPTPGAAGSEPYRFQTGGGIHGNSSGGVALSVAAGDAVSVDAQANVSLPQRLAVAKLATLSGGLSSPSATIGQLTVTGDTGLNGNLGIGGSVQITGDLTARKITATSDLSAASLSTLGHIAGGSLTITGETILAGLSVTGTFKASQIESDGIFYFPSSDPSMPGLALADEHGTGLFAVAGTIGLSVQGRSAVSFGANLTATFPGAVDAASVAADSAVFTGLQTGTVTATGLSTLAGIKGSALALTGAATIASSLDVGGNFSVAGTTRLANLAIDMLSTDHDLTVGGDARVVGGLVVGGATQLQGLTVQGGAVMGPINAGRVIPSDIRILGGSSGNPPVLRDPIPNSPGTTDYIFVLDGNGALSMSSDLYVGGVGRFHKALSCDSSFSAASAALAGGLSVGGDAQIAGQLVALRSVVGGSTFQTVHGSPNGQLTGSVGDVAVDSDSGLLYLKLMGSQSQTGWVGVTTQANATGFPLLAPDTAPTAVPFGFASDAGTGLGRNSQLPLYLAVGGTPALTFTATGAASFAAALTAQSDLTAQGKLTVQGATALQGLTAGTTQVGTFTAGGSTLGTLNAQATTVTSLSAQAATLATLHVLGAATLDSTLAVAGAITSTASVSAPRLLAGLAALSSGDGSPNGQVGGNPGDIFIQRDTPALWQKYDASANAGWMKAGGGGGGSFPMAAPLSANLAAPSYGFQGSQMGLTDQGANILVGITAAKVGWTLDASQNFSLAAGLTVAGASGLQAVTATSLGAGSLNVTGASSLAGVTAAAIQATSLTTTTGSVTSGQNVTAAGTVSGTLVVSNGSTWRASSTAPAAGIGQAGDIASIQGASDHPLQVRTSGTWKVVALVGDPAPSQFPLLGPVDSAVAPNYSTSLSPNTGMYFPAANQIAWSTNGLIAGSVDANQNWTFVGGVSGGAATFSGLTVNGASSLTGNVSVGGTFQATGMATFSSGITAQSAAISQGITASTATINGQLSVQSINTTGDVSIGGNLTVQGTTTYTGVQRSGFFQTGDGLISAPAYAFTNETGLGIWRRGAGNLAFAANGGNMLSLTGASAVFSGTGSFAGTVSAPIVDTPAVRNSGGTLSLQAGTTTVLSLATTGIGAAVPVAVPAGSSSSPGLVVGAGGGLFSANDARPTFPVSVSLTNPRGNGLSVTTVPDTNTNSNYFILAAGSGGITSGAFAPNGYANGAPGYFYSYSGGGSGTSAYVYEGTSGGNGGWVAIRTASQPVVPTYPAVGPAGSAAAPTFAVGGSNYGLFLSTTANQANEGSTSLAYKGKSVGNFFQGAIGVTGNTYYAMTLGDASQTAQLGGILAGATAPVGNITGVGGQIYQQLNGGPTSSLHVYEGTTPGTSAWAKVLTTSSSVPASFPLLAPADSATAPSYSWSAESGLGWYRSAAATMVAVAAGAPLATLTTGLLTLPGALRVGGTNAGLTSPGANQLALQTAGTTALSIAASGVTSHAFQAQFIAGTVAAPSVAVGGATSGLYSGTDQSSFPFVGVSQAGNPVAYLWRANVTAGTVYALNLGDPASASVVGGIKAGTFAPQGNIGSFGGQIYQMLNGGPGQSLWVHEGTGTGTNNSWAKVLTTSSTITPSFPMQSTTLGSATSPAYGFATSGFTTTGIYAGTNGGLSCLGITATGVSAANFLTQTVNSAPVYSMFFGGINAANGDAGGIRSFNQSPVGVLGAFQGQICLNSAAGAGTTLWVKESWSASNSVTGWAYAFTSGMTQLAAGNGTSAAPYYSFSGDKTSGLYFGDVPYMVNAGKLAIGFLTNFAGLGYSGITFGPTNTDGVPYMFAIPSTAGSAGNPNTLAVPAARAALMLNGAGAAGNQIWIHEPTASSTGWVRVLTENTAQSFARLLQTTAPAAVTGQTLIYARTDNQIGVVTSANTLATTLKQEVAAAVYGASQTMAVAQNGVTAVAAGATQFTLTLSATQAGTDTTYNFQIEGTGGFKIQAPAGVTIYLGANATSSGGTLTSSTIGSFVTLFNRAGSSLWIARGTTGTWVTA